MSQEPHPFRYLRPGVSAELAALLAARDLGLPLLDEICLRWILLRISEDLR